MAEAPLPPARFLHCPGPRELDDLELILSGALEPRSGFDDQVVTLSLPDEWQDVEVELVDPEGLPLARLHADRALSPLKRPEYGPFRRLFLTPAETVSRHPGALFVPVESVLSVEDLRTIEEERRGREVVLLTLAGTGAGERLGPIGLVKCTLAAAADLGGAHVVVVPLSEPGRARGELRGSVIRNYAAGDVLDRVASRGPLTPSVESVVQPRLRRRRGLVLFFTGLSGSGKSTLARALVDRLLEETDHEVTSLDGDVVRRNLSAGLSFSAQDRETNIRRIGWVAAEIARHGGVAVCSPIAPTDTTRQAVRRMVADAGGQFLLIHVATPLEECERRDRKGLYAKARAGEIPEFTGISSPYEAPANADVVVETTGRSLDECVAEVASVVPFLPAST